MSDLPEGWESIPLTDVCEIRDQLRIPINSSERKARISGKIASDLYPYYGATGQVGQIDGFLFEGEHVLIGEDGAPFLDSQKSVAYIVRGKFWVNNHAHILRAHLSNQFLCHFLNSIPYEDYVSGTTRLKLNQATMRKIPVLMPPLNEQHRIVEKIENLFAELDKGEESLRAAKAQAGLYRQSLLKHAFEGHLTAGWRASNSDKLEDQEALLSRIKFERDTHYKQAVIDWQKALEVWLNEGKIDKKPAKPTKLPNVTEPNAEELADRIALPKGWKYLHIRSLCEVVRGGSPRPAGDERYYNGDIPFLKVADLTRKKGMYVDSFTYSIKPAGLSKTRLVKPNTLLISNSGATLGVPKICRIEATFNDGVAAFLRLDPGSQKYLYWFWTSQTQFLRQINQGAAQPNLNTGLIGDTLLPICSPSEQAEIVTQLDTKLSTLDALEQDIDTQIAHSTALRQSILKRAFSGHLVPQDPTDEPATKLLARIKAEKAATSKPARKKKANA